MDYVHACEFCGWEREALTAVVLPPGCPDCGCPVDSEPRARATERALAALADAAPPPFTPGLAVRALVCLFALCFACAAARVGFHVAEAAGAIAGVGLAGLLLLPLVPERIGDARPRSG